MKSKVDIEGVRTSLKTQAEKDTFDNAIRKMLAGAELTKAEAALVAARVPDLKQPRKMGPSDFKLAGGVIKTSMRSALANSPSFVKYLETLVGAPSDSEGERIGLINRLADDEMVQAQVANGLEQFKTMELGKGRFPTNESTPLRMAMPSQFKSDDIVESYRRFYASKPRVRYPKSKVPKWFIKYRKDKEYQII